MQLTLVAIFASSLGLIFGYGLQHLLLTTLQGIINTDLPPPSSRPVILGFITATFVIFATASPYIKILSETEPIRILRNDFNINLSSNLMRLLDRLILKSFLKILIGSVSLRIFI